MKIRKFQYLKESAGVPKKYEVLVLKDDVGGFEGISLKDLKEEDRKALLELQLEHEKRLQPYIEHYRRFLNTKMIDFTDEKITG